MWWVGGLLPFQGKADKYGDGVIRPRLDPRPSLARYSPTAVKGATIPNRCFPYFVNERGQGPGICHWNCLPLDKQGTEVTRTMEMVC